jgi:hypothetical protein
MICLEVSLNGDVIGSAGVDPGIINLNLMRASLPNWSRTEISLQETACRPASTGEDLAPKLRAALQHPERPPSTQTVYWIDRQQLKAGDEITIKLIEVPDVNPPDQPPDVPKDSN